MFEMSLSRIESLLKRFPAPKHERRRLYAPESKCAEDGCVCFLHTHFRSYTCGRHECWERIDEEIDLRLEAENRTTTLLQLVRNVGAVMKNPRVAMDMLLSANLPKLKHPRSFEIKEMGDDECDSDDGCSNEMHSHYCFCTESGSCDERIRGFFESRLLAESIENSHLIGLDRLRRIMEELIKASSSGAATAAEVENVRMDLLRIGEAEAAAAETLHPEGLFDFMPEDLDEECESDLTRPAEHEPSCPLFKRDDGVASAHVCTCGNVSPFYPSFK